MLLSFSSNRNLLYALTYWIIEIIFRCFKRYRKEDFSIIENDDAANEYLYLLLDNFSDLLGGFLVVGIKCSFLWHRNKYKNAIRRDINIKTLILLFICIGSLDYLNRSSFFIFFEISGAKSDNINILHKIQGDLINLLDILIRYLFSIIILKIKVYKHHKLSIFLIFITFVFLLIIDILSLIYDKTGMENIDTKITLIYIAILSIRAVLFPLEDIIIKKVFTIYYILPETLMFLRGLIVLIHIIIITPILYHHLKMTCSNEYDSSKISTNIFIIFSYIVATFFKANLVLKVIYYFSSQSVSFLIIAESITGSITQIIKDIGSGNDKFYFIIMEIIAILIALFATLIYDEIIIIKKCEFDENVATEIIKRANTEIEKLGEIIIEDNGEGEDINVNEEEDIGMNESIID